MRFFSQDDDGPVLCGFNMCRAIIAIPSIGGMKAVLQPSNTAVTRLAMGTWIVYRCPQPQSPCLYMILGGTGKHHAKV